MAKKNREVLKSYFKTGKIPTQQHYEELIDSMLNLPEDGIENGSKDIKVAQGLLLTPGGCLNAASEHYRLFSQGVKIQTKIPFALTVEGPPLLIVEGYNFTTMQTIGLMVPFEYEYDTKDFTISNLNKEDIRQRIARLSTKPISSELVEIQGKKPDPNKENEKIDATWVVDAKQPELVWEVITNDQNITQVENRSLTDLNTFAALKIKTDSNGQKATATAWGSYRPPLKLSVEEEKITLLMVLQDTDKKNSSFRVSFNVRAVGGKKGYEDWYKGWTVTEATEEEISDSEVSVEYKD